MRQCATSEAFRPTWGPHAHAQALTSAGEILDQHPEIGELVHRDVVGAARSDTGRPGLTGAQVLRIALLKQIHGLSYRELEFHLQDSAAFRSFVGLGLEDRPSFQALQDRGDDDLDVTGGRAPAACNDR
ncbi:MAG TPA: transposase [Myxococcota bacterium]|nr:transposase [Myxococcota bacterium]